MFNAKQQRDAYDIWLIAGQSNTYVGTGLDGAIDVSNSYTDSCNENATIVTPANDPIQTYAGIAAGYIGFAMTMARQHAAKIIGRRKILIVHCGLGGSGFGTVNNWTDTTGQLRERTINRATAAVNLSPGNRVTGIFWCQGESDANSGGSFVTNYLGNLEGLFSDFREQIPTATYAPIVVSSMTGWTLTQPNGITINAIHAAIVSSVTRSVYVNNTDLGLADIHFNAAEQRIIGVRNYNAWNTLN